MALMTLAMWLQESEAVSNHQLLLVLVIVIAVAAAIVVVLLVVLAVAVMKAIKDVTRIAEEVKGKALPLVEEATAISKSSRAIIDDAAPKVKAMTESLVRATETIAETTQVAKTAVVKLESTVSDANMRTQRQVARVDGMVTTALNTTAEIVETVNHGIRVPAHKIAVMATQAKYVVEGLLDKVKSMSGKLPFGTKKQPNRYETDIVEDRI